MGETPPVAVTVTVDDPPLQLMADADELADKAVGWLMVKLTDLVHPLASFTVTVWLPAATPLNVLEDWYDPLLSL